MAKIFGYGSQLTVATSSTGELDIGCIRNISGPGTDADDVDTTCLDSSTNFRTMVPGLIDPGEVSFEVIYDSTSSSHSLLYHYHNSLTPKVYTVLHGSSTGDADSFTAYVKSMSREIPLDDMITAEYTLKVSGDPGYTS